jgi:NADPH:quinone reductase-like Zn-dependent oxidoreductase
VESVGSQVTTLQPGDEVFGWCGGSFAEYASVPEDQLLPKPANLTLEQAAAVPISGFTPLQGVRDRGRVRAGRHVLVTGASGGVGTYAVQIAKAYGAEVTAVCSAAKADLVRSIGADHVIDYATADFASGPTRYDVLLDIYGNPSLSRCRRAVKPGGTITFIGGTGGRWFMGVDRWLRALLVAPFLRRNVRPLVHKDRREDLATLTDLIESGKVTPVIDRTFPLAEVAEAIKYVQDGRARGQVVIAIDNQATRRGDVVAG